MTLKQLEDFKAQITNQINHHKTQTPPAGQELLYNLGAIELQVGLNLITQLIQMEQSILAAPPGAMGPEI